MSIYSGPFAELYDLIYQVKDYEGESKAITEMGSSHGVHSPGRLLDVACGTGKHSMCLHDLGWIVTGVDASEDMLEKARADASESGRDVSFELQDMRALSLGSTFDVIVCLFDSIGYVISDDGVIETLSAIGDHLEPEGVFIFEMWHAPAMLQHHEPVRIRRIEDREGREIVRISETAVDVSTSTARVDFTFFVPDSDSSYVRYAESHRNRFFTVPEMEALLGAAGLASLGWYPGLIEDGEIDHDTWHVVGAARRQ